MERTDTIGLIEEHFKELEGEISQQSSFITTVVTEGDPGLGKSQIARQFGYKYFVYFAARRSPVVVCTLHAGNLQDLCQSYLKLAEQLEVDISTIKGMDSLQAKLEELVRDVGSKISKYPGWLVIVDNLMNWTDSEEGKEIFRYIPHSSNPRMNSWGSGKVLITMQLRDKFKETKGNPLRVVRQEDLELKLPAAKTLLTEVSGSAGKGKVLERIIKKLGYNILALISAAMYKKLKTEEDPDYTWEDYSKKSFEQALRIQRDKKEYQQVSVAASLCLALGKLASKQVAKLAFVAIAFYDHKSVPKELIVQFVKAKIVDHDKRASDVIIELEIGNLIEFPLISSTRPSSSGEKKVIFYNVHQFTHKVLRSDMLQETQWGSPLNFLFPLMSATLSCEESEKDYWVLGYLVPHMYALGRFAMKIYEEEKSSPVCPNPKHPWHHIPQVLYRAVYNSNMYSISTSDQHICLDECIEMADEIPTSSNAQKVQYLSLKADRLEISGEEQAGIDLGFKALEMAKQADDYKLVTHALHHLRSRAVYKRGIKAYEDNWKYVEANGKDSIAMAVSLYFYGDLLAMVDRPKARVCLERAVQILRGHDDPRLLATSIDYCGRFLLSSWSSADTLRGLEMARECESIAAEKIGRHSRTYCNRSLTLGRALLTNYKPREAIEHLEPLLDEMKAYKVPGQEFNYYIVMGLSYLFLGNINRCCAMFNECIRIMDEHDLDYPPEFRYTLRPLVKTLPVVNVILVKPLKCICSCLRVWNHR